MIWLNHFPFVDEWWRLFKAWNWLLCPGVIPCRMNRCNIWTWSASALQDTLRCTRLLSPGCRAHGRVSITAVEASRQSYTFNHLIIISLHFSVELVYFIFSIRFLIIFFISLPNFISFTCFIIYLTFNLTSNYFIFVSLF